MNINCQTRKIALLGYPLGHSISPFMHNKAFELLGLNYIYLPLEVEPERLGKVVEALIALNFTGFNVTVPHKERIMDYCSRLSADAGIIGAVNTVMINDGELYGDNSDWLGFGASLNREGFNPCGKRCVVVGAGGAARSVLYALLRADPCNVTVINRSIEKAEKMVKHFQGHMKDTGVNVLDIGAGEAIEACREAHLIVNTTPLGMKPRLNQSPLPPTCFAPGQVVVDLIYNPPSTLFLDCAANAGAKTVNGLGMLILQGAYGFKKWTGNDFPVKTIENFIKKEGIFKAI